MKSGKTTQAKLRILAALTVGFVMMFASAVTAQPMTDCQGQNHQDGHHDKHQGHQGHQGH